MTVECAYCGSNVVAHDPIAVREGLGESSERRGAFCNYACLHAWIEREDLLTGSVCKWEPSGED